MEDPFELLARSVDRQSVIADIQRLDGEITERAERKNKLMLLLSLLPEPGADAESDAEPAPIANAKPKLADAVLYVIADGGRDAVWSADEVLSALVRNGWQPGGRTPRNSVDATLSRLRRNGKLRKVATGRYRLSPAQTGEDGAAGNSAATLLDQGEEV